MARAFLSILICALWLAAVSAAHAQKSTREILGFGAAGATGAAGAGTGGNRIALMMGNASYASVGRLDNPVNDAREIGRALEAVGFTVTYRFDLGRAATVEALNEFRRSAAGAEAAIIYYAGHGIEVDKQNYMIPVDAELLAADDVDFQAVPLDLFMLAVGGANRLSLVITDACRNNPFMNRMRPSVANRAIGRGLRAVEPVGNTLVAYAAREGTLASDGDTGNSPYARALVKALATDGLEIGKFFRQVRDDVLVATGNAQEPFVYGSLSSEDFYFRPPAGRADPPPADNRDDPPRPDDSGAMAAIELEFWKTVSEMNRPEGYRAYLERYPDGSFAAVARLMLEPKPKAGDRGDTGDPADGRRDDRRDDPRDDRRDDRIDGVAPRHDPPTAARKVFDSRDGYHIPGMDIRGSERLGISFRACADLCASIDRCRAFSYNQARRGCYPKTGIRRIEPYRGVASGAVKELSDQLFARADARPDPPRGGGVEYDTDFPGGDIWPRGIRGVSRTRCRAICLEQSACVAYTYVPDSDWCFPKTHVSRRRAERRAVSEMVR